MRVNKQKLSYHLLVKIHLNATLILFKNAFAYMAKYAFKFTGKRITFIVNRDKNYSIKADILTNIQASDK